MMLLFIVAAAPTLCTSTTDAPVTDVPVTDVPVTDVPTSNVTDIPPIIYDDATIGVDGAVCIALTIPVIFIVLLCVCAHGYKGDNHRPCRAIIYCCNCLAILVLLTLLIPASVLVYLPKDRPNSDCIYLEAPITTVGFTYAFIVLACCSWFVCLCAPFIGAINEYDTIL